MTKIKGAALPKMGMNRQIGNAYLYGPKRYQGIEFPNVYTELCVKQVQMLLKHGGRNTQLGISLTSCLEGHQLEIGIGTKLFDLNYEKYGFLVTDSIAKHTWKMLHETGLHIMSTHATPWLARENDSFLMTEIIDKTEYGIPELQAINWCRMYLNVVSVSDISEGNCTTVTANAYMGVKDYDRPSTWNWPTLPSPPKKDWNKWRGALEHTFLRNDTQILRTNLGKWTRTLHQQWTWFLSPSTTELYEVRGTTVFKHPRIGRRLRSKSCHVLSFQTCTLPTNATQTTIKPTETQSFTQGTAPDSPTPDVSTDDIWSSAPRWIPNGLMRDCHLPDRWETIIRSLCDGTCVAVTDGSYDPDSQYATACWIIEGEGESRCKGASHPPPPATTMKWTHTAPRFSGYTVS